MIEREHLGGICLNWGCIPTKALLRTSEIFHLMHRAKEFGLKAENVGYDLDAVVKRSRGVAKQLSGGVGFLMKKNKIDVVMGEAKLKGQGKIAVKTEKGAEEIQAKAIIIATGARARDLPGLEADGKRVWNYKHALMPPHMPKKLLVIGSGAIGIEFASFYNTLGAETTVVEVLPRILPVEDEEISAFAKKQFQKQKMTILEGATVKKLERGADKVTATIENRGKEKTEDFDTVISAVGIVGNVENLGLEELGREGRPDACGGRRALPDRGRRALCDRRRRRRALARAQGEPRGRDGGRADRRAASASRSSRCRSPAAPTASRRWRASG